LVVLNLPSPPKQTRLEGGSNCESLSSLFMHSTMDKIISLTFLFFLFLFFLCRHRVLEVWRRVWTESSWSKVEDEKSSPSILRIKTIKENVIHH
jgi:hypothetical protein